MKLLLSAAALAAVFATPAQAQLSGLDLSNYRLVASYDLPAVAASEASAVTWNWDSDSLFVLGDEGDALVEVDKQGNQLSVMSLSGFDDTEGVTYIGNGQFVVLEERLQDAYLLTYQAGGSVSRSSLSSVSVGATVGNVGLEGISFDPRTGRYVAVKEKTPQAVYDLGLNFSNGSADVINLLPPANSFAQIFGTLDLADVQVLASVPALAAGADADNLLVYSQESSRLLEVTRDGQILSSFDFAALADNAEGVTIDALGRIYVVGENPTLYVLAAVPEPETYAMLLAGLGLIGLARRRSR